MRMLEVGKLFEEGKTKYPEGVKFDFYQEGPVLYLFFNRPTEKEIESVKSGKFEIAMYAREEIIFILAKFQGMEWMDAPYSVHLSKPFEFESIETGKGFGLNTFLVDASTGILKVIRFSGLSTDFSLKFVFAIENQRRLSFDNASYEQKLNAIYGNYSTSDLVQRADAFCRIRG